MAIADFVLLHNKAAEALAKSDRVGFDFYNGIADLKALLLKYCKPYEKRLQSMVPTHRVVPAGSGEDPTTVSVPGFVVDAKAKGKRNLAPMNIEMQFIEKHKKLYMDLHREFIAFPLPVADDPAIDAVVMRLDPVQVADHRRLDG